MIVVTLKNKKYCKNLKYSEAALGKQFADLRDAKNFLNK